MSQAQVLATFTKRGLECFVLRVEGTWEGERIEGWVALPPGHSFYGEIPAGFGLCTDNLRVGSRIERRAWFVGRVFPKDAPLPSVKAEMRKVVEQMVDRARVKKGTVNR